MHVIMRFAKRKGGQISSMERHNERKKEKYASNPDIDLDRTKDNYHIIQPNNTYYREINSRIKAAGCRLRKDSVKMVEVYLPNHRNSSLQQALKSTESILREQSSSYRPKLEKITFLPPQYIWMKLLRICISALLR